MTTVIAETTGGPVAGAAGGGVRRWLGVPYAKAARFGAPEPLEPWSELRPAVAMAPQCPQLLGGSVRHAKTKPPAFSEDCLALNIWAPEGDDGGARPVFVWIHGGAFVGGGCNPYDGADLAKRGDMVVVAINYRLGILGFVNLGEALGLPGMPSNLGLRDQIAALEWVRDNIAAFGGDPDRVTVAGESAGSICVSLLTMCRKAWPLFHGAIMQSGTGSLIHDHATSLRIARRYAELLGVNQGDLAALQDMKLTRLYEAQATVGAEERNGLPAAPWFDSDLLPDTIADAETHPTAPVPLMAGSTREEIRLFEVLPGEILPRKWVDLEALVRGQLPADHAERVLAVYPRTTAGRRALGTDLAFGMPTRHFAERHARHSSTWLYRFDYGGPLVGAAHSLDLAFLWPYRGPLVALMRGWPMAGARQALARRVQAHWAHFTRHGRPQSDWPAYSPDAQEVRLFNLKDSIAANPDADRFAAWNGRDVRPGLTLATVR